MTPRRILVLGWLAFLVLYAWPGYLTTTAINEMLDSRAGSFTDWNSPVMTEVWRIVGRVIAGPPGMLLLQSGLLLFGSNVLLRRILAPRAAAIASVCLLVFPPVMANTAVISEDALLAGFLIAACAAFTSERRILGLVFAALACGMREGALVAALPVVVAGFVWRHDRTRYPIALAAWLACAVIASVLTRVLPAETSHTKEGALAMVDIVGVLNFAPPIEDATLRAIAPDVQWAQERAQDRARAVHGRPSRYAYGAERVLEAPETLADTDALIALRAELIRAYPQAYLRARFSQWRRLTASHRHAVYTRSTESRDQRVVAGHDARHSPIQKLGIRAVTALDGSVLFMPYLYVALAVLLLPLAIWRRQREAISLLASAIAFQGALFVVTWDREFRYSHWTMVATLVAGVLVIAHAKLNRASASPG